MSQMSRGEFKAQFVEEDLTTWAQSKKWPVFVGAKKDGECLKITKKGDQILLSNMRKREHTNESLRRIGHGKFLEALLTAIKADGEYIGEGIVGDGGRHNGKPALSRYMSVIAHGEAEAAEGPLRIMFHDIAEMNGQNMMHLSHQERLAYLRSAIVENERVELEEGRTCQTISEVQDFYKDVTGRGFEGIVVKADVPLSWASFLKMKPTHTLDVAILAIEKTEGYKKNGVSQSYAIGVWNPAMKEWVSAGEVGTGFSDEDLGRIMGNLKSKVTKEDDHFIYVEPTVVIEVKYQEINLGDDATWHLRFPRLVRIRDDKAPTECLYRQLTEQFKAQSGETKPAAVPTLNPPAPVESTPADPFAPDYAPPSPYKVRCRTCAGPVTDGRCLRCFTEVNLTSQKTIAYEEPKSEPEKAEPPQSLYSPEPNSPRVVAVGRFQVLGILEAARAEFLGMPVEKALSFGLNRSIFYAAAKRGFAPSHKLQEGSGAYARAVSKTQNLETVTVGNEKALVNRRTGWFTIGGQDQTPEAFNRQIAGRVKDFNMAWREAIKLVSSFPDDVLLNQQAFFERVYKPNRDSLSARWSS